MLSPQRTAVDGDRATETGSFRQVVKTPDGTVVRPSGTFTIDWIRVAAGTWRILRAATTPNP